MMSENLKSYKKKNLWKCLALLAVGLILSFAWLRQSTFLANNYNKLGFGYSQDGDDVKAIQYHKKALAIYNNKKGEFSLPAGHTQHALGNAYRRIQEYDQAIQKLEQALEIFIDNHADAEQRAIILGDLAKTHQEAEHYETSADYLRKILALQLKGLYPRTYLELSINAHAQGNLQQATQYIDEALQAQGEAYDAFTPQIYKERALLYREMGEPKKAIEALEKASLLEKKLFGEQSPTRADTWQKLAEIYIELEKHDLASIYCQNALNILSSHGIKNNCTIKVYRILSFAFAGSQKSFQYSQAIQYLQKALAISRNINGDNAPITADIYHELGILTSKNNNTTEGIQYLLHALKIREARLENLKSQHAQSQVARSYFALGVAYGLQGNVVAAEEYLQYANEITEELPDHPTIETVQVHLNLGRSQQKQGRNKKATEHYKEALSLCQKELPTTDDPIFRIIYRLLGDVLNQQKQYSAAIECYEKSLHNELNDKKRATIYQKLAKTHSKRNKRGDKDKAIQYLQKNQALLPKKSEKYNENMRLTYQQIGTLQSEKGDTESAIKSLLEAGKHIKASCEIGIFEDFKEKFFGDAPLILASNYQALGNLFHQQGDDNQAISYHKKAFYIFDYHRKQVQETIIRYDHETRMHLFYGRWFSYSDRHSKEFYIFEYQQKIIQTATIHYELGIFYNAAGQPRKAAKHLQKACEQRKEAFGIDALPTAEAYEALGNFYGEQRKWKQAIECLTQAATSRKKVLGSEHPLTKKTYKAIQAIQRQRLEGPSFYSRLQGLFQNPFTFQ